MPLFVILDNSIYSVILGLVLGPKGNCTKLRNALNALINRDNATYKNLNYILTEQDSSLYLRLLYT